MTDLTPIRFGAGTLYVEDPATPGTYIKLIGYTQLSLAYKKSTGTTVVPDPDDPDAAAWEVTDTTSLGWSIGGQGVCAAEQLPLLDTLSQRGTSVPIRWDVAGAGKGVGTPKRRYAGNAVITHDITGQRGERYQVKLDGTGDGPLTPTDVAADA